MRRIAWVIWGLLVFHTSMLAQIAHTQEAHMPVMQCGYTNHFPVTQPCTRFFYVSAQGDDTHDGHTPATAWKKLEKVNATAFSAGDAVLFEGGSTFTGTLTLQMTAPGSAEHPVIIGSYGQGQAVINGQTGNGVVIRGCTGVSVRNLKVIGAGRKTGNTHGTGVLLDTCQFCLVDQIDVSGFQHAGVEVRGSSDIRLTHVHAHDNGYAGISSAGRGRSKDLYLGDCRAINNAGDPTILNNHSGNGIVLGNLAGATVEYCEATENGWDMPWHGNGPVGIWCHSADRVLFQYNISHDNKTSKGAADGGGFDFDGGTTNSVMQYNYSYNNAGCGYLLCEYQGGPLFAKNVLRYNISQHDGHDSHKAGIVTYDGGGAGFRDCDIYNNVVYVSKDCDAVKLSPSPGFVFHNNIFIVSGYGKLIEGAMNAVFQGNWYQVTGNAAFDVDGYESLAAWSTASGQEMLDGICVGHDGDPRLTQAGMGAPLTDPRQLPHLLAYLAQPDSPLIGAGINLPQRFTLACGDVDFWGNSLPTARMSIGVHEPLGAPATRQAATITTFTPPDQHPHIAPLPATYTITRLNAITAVEQVAPALGQLPEHPITRHGRTLAGLRFAIAGEQLALSGHITDASIQRGAHPWDGSELELYALAADGKTISQLFLLPATKTDPVQALVQQDGGQQPATDIRLATTLTADGYELIALIPLSRLHLAPDATEVALEFMVATTPVAIKTVEYATLFHSISAFMDARNYGRMKVIRE